MSGEDASAIAALNQTIRALVEVLCDLNRLLDEAGYPRPKGDESG